VDRLPRRRRNQLCIAIITVGLLNFVAYTLTYAALGGDAHNGYCKLVAGPDGELLRTYVVGGPPRPARGGRGTPGGPGGGL
jgi:hypothetical protein